MHVLQPPNFVQQAPCQYVVADIAQLTVVPCCGCKFDKHVTPFPTRVVVNLAV